VDEDFNDAFDDAGFDVSPTPEPAQVGMASVDEGDALDYTQRTTIPGTNITGFISPQSYMETRGATVTNPFPDSIFSRIFGAENVDYTNILGSGGVQDVNNLRYRQAMGLPSLNRPGQDYRMGDFYIGQPTMEGTVREVPRGGIIDMIPGLSTITNLFGRNRGLPESSDAFKREMAKSQQSVQPLTDIINSITSGIGSLTDRFRSQETDTNPMNMPMAAIRDEVPQFNYGNIPSGSTFGSMPTNTGIANVRPQEREEADMSVADALQLIPSNLETNPIAPISKVRTSLLPSSVFNLLPTAQNRRDRDFSRDVFALSPRLRQQQFGPVDPLASIDQDYFNRIRNQKPFEDTGNFIVLD